MNISHIAKPYAKALFDLALERNALEDITKDMKVVAETCISSKDLFMMLKSPVINSEKKAKVIQAVFSKAISKLSLTYLLIIIRKKRERYIPEIAEEFLELYKDYKGILTTHFTTAVPLSDEIRQKIIHLMKEQTHNEIELIESTDADLIGGFILKWKDKQYDASILHEIKKMHRGSARINLYVKGF
jgi:F-type H+-transporting ATPase subunit delta